MLVVQTVPLVPNKVCLSIGFGEGTEDTFDGAGTCSVVFAEVVYEVDIAVWVDVGRFSDIEGSLV